MSLREFTPKGTSVAAETYPSDEPEEYGDDVNLNAEPGAAELAEIERSGLEAEPGTYSFDSGTPETNRGEKDAFDNNDVLPLGERIARAQYDRAAQMNHLRAYKDTIGKIALLSASQEVELAKRIEAGLYASQQLQEARRTDAELPDKLRRDLTLIAEEGKVAKDRYILANLRLVVSVAQHYEYRAMSMGLMDLIQVGNMGLIRAVEGFDYQRGFKFSTYAIWCIRSVISGALAKEARLIHIPQYKVEEILNAANKDRDLRVALSRKPTPAELASKLGITESELRKLWQIARMQPHSLDLQVEQGEASLREVVADMRSSPENDPILLAEGEILVDQLLARLPERLALVLRYRLGLVDGEEWSHERIGQEVLGGVSRETARNRQSAAVKRLKDLGATEGL